MERTLCPLRPGGGQQLCSVHASRRSWGQAAPAFAGVAFADAQAPAAPATQPTSSAPTVDRSAEARRSRAERFGGGRKTEDAVDAGVAWLVVHQSADGAWLRDRFHHLCPPNDRCPSPSNDRTRPDLSPGITGLCLLALVGAGHATPGADHQRSVAAAVAWLLRSQRGDGGFGADEEMAGYNDALSVLALAEHQRAAPRADVSAAVRAGVARLAASQQALGGWDYVRSSQSGRNDTSISAWTIQALLAAHAAGAAAPPQTLPQAALYLRRASETDGWVRYSDTGVGTKIGPDGKLVYRYGAGMTAAAATCALLLGWRADGELVRPQLVRLIEEPPSLAGARGPQSSDFHNEYYWYYGTTALFQAGGSTWARWNAALTDVMLPLQERRPAGGGPGRHRVGSFDPYGPGWGKWGRMGGRVYVTAISVLTLQVYYRSLPSWLAEEPPIRAESWTAYCQTASPAQRRFAAECLADMRLEIGEPALLPLLRDGDGGVALAAAIALAKIDSPAGRTILQRVQRTNGAGAGPATDAALERLADMERRAVRGEVRLFDAERRLVTLRIDRSYIGQRLIARRHGLTIAQFEVVRRYSEEDLTLARVTELDAQNPPATGDAVEVAAPRPLP